MKKTLDTRGAWLYLAEACDGADERGDVLVCGEVVVCRCSAAKTLKKHGCITEDVFEQLQPQACRESFHTKSDAVRAAAWCREQAAKLEQPTTDVTCTACGNVLRGLRPDDIAFCLDCGTDNKKPEPPAEPMHLKKPSASKAYWDDTEAGFKATYGGGYRDPHQIEIFHHGMSTVFNWLRANHDPESITPKDPKPVEQPAGVVVTKPVNKYAVTMPQPSDIYDILVAYNVTCPAVQHAVKKLLCAGKRGHKSREVDLAEAKAAIERAIGLADARRKAGE